MTFSLGVLTIGVRDNGNFIILLKCTMERSDKTGQGHLVGQQNE